MEDNQLLMEIQDILNTMPPRATLAHDLPVNWTWLGRAVAAVSAWDRTQAPKFRSVVDTIHTRNRPPGTPDPYQSLLTTLSHALHDLRMKTQGPMTQAVNTGKVFEYFDGIRQLVEEAKIEVFFVDPFLDPAFVTRYLHSVGTGVRVRLLGREKVGALAAAASEFSKQEGHAIEVRQVGNFHDRYLFVDHLRCVQSGASFKDGGKFAPTTLTEIVDAFEAVSATYEKLWADAKVIGT